MTDHNTNPFEGASLVPVSVKHTRTHIETEGVDFEQAYYLAGHEPPRYPVPMVRNTVLFDHEPELGTYITLHVDDDTGLARTQWCQYRDPWSGETVCSRWDNNPWVVPDRA